MSSAARDLIELKCSISLRLTPSLTQPPPFPPNPLDGFRSARFVRKMFSVFVRSCSRSGSEQSGRHTSSGILQHHITQTNHSESETHSNRSHPIRDTIQGKPQTHIHTHMKSNKHKRRRNLKLYMWNERVGCLISSSEEMYSESKGR